jgi:hypothetical protein
MMPVFSSPIHAIRLRRTRMKQKRTALHMLALSGVIRPSHVELRYTTPVSSITASRKEPTAIMHSLVQPIPLRSWEHNLTFNLTQTRQWLRSLSFAVVQLANKPIALHWDKQLDV